MSNSLQFHGILQARKLEWVAFPFSRASSPPGIKPKSPHCRQILYQLSHKGSPRIVEWVAYPLSSGSSQSRNWTRVSCIAGRFFTNWAIREAPSGTLLSHKKSKIIPFTAILMDLQIFILSQTQKDKCNMTLPICRI